MSGVVGEAGDGAAQAFVAGPAEDDRAVLAGGVGDRADAGFGGEVFCARETSAVIAELGEDLRGADAPRLGKDMTRWPSGCSATASWTRR